MMGSSADIGSLLMSGIKQDKLGWSVKSMPKKMAYSNKDKMMNKNKQTQGWGRDRER